MLLSHDRVMAHYFKRSSILFLRQHTVMWFLRMAPPAVTIAWFLAPLHTCWYIYKDGSVRDLPILPFLSLLVNCGIWTAYGICIASSPVIVPNVIGFIAGLLYTSIYVWFSNGGSDQRKSFLASLMLLTYVMYAWTYAPPGRECLAFGRVGAFTSIVLCLSPLTAILTVLKTKSTASMPLLPSLALFIASSLWTAYGYMDAHDVNIWLPNAIGFCAGVLQLACHAVYNRGCSLSNEKEGVRR